MCRTCRVDRSPNPAAGVPGADRPFEPKEGAASRTHPNSPVSSSPHPAPPGLLPPHPDASPDVPQAAGPVPVPPHPRRATRVPVCRRDRSHDLNVLDPNRYMHGLTPAVLGDWAVLLDRAVVTYGKMRIAAAIARSPCENLENRAWSPLRFGVAVVERNGTQPRKGRRDQRPRARQCERRKH